MHICNPLRHSSKLWTHFLAVRKLAHIQYGRVQDFVWKVTFSKCSLLLYEYSYKIFLFYGRDTQYKIFLVPKYFTEHFYYFNLNIFVLDTFTNLKYWIFISIYTIEIDCVRQSWINFLLQLKQVRV